MPSQSRIINNYINFAIFVLILILSIKSSLGHTELANLNDISPQNLISSSSYLSYIKKWFIGSSESNEISESRTFGHIRRLQMALLPILFKFGVLSAMIGLLVFLALKTVFLLKTILFLNAGALLIKLVSWKIHQETSHAQPILYGWNPHQINTWPQQNHIHGWEKSHDNKEVHLHIHNDGGKTSEIYHPQIWNRNSNNEPYQSYSNRNNKRDINYDDEIQNYGPVTVSKSYRNVERGNYIN